MGIAMGIGSLTWHVLGESKASAISLYYRYYRL